MSMKKPSISALLMVAGGLAAVVAAPAIAGQCAGRRCAPTAHAAKGCCAAKGCAAKKGCSAKKGCAARSCAPKR